MRLCRCGAIVEGKCSQCSKPSQLRGTTAQRGYDNKWRKLSERYRAVNPLCERCKEQGKATAASEVHHKMSIAEAPELRLTWGNLMAVCGPCHREIERGKDEDGA